MKHNKKMIYFLLVIFLIIVNNLRLSEGFKSGCDTFFNKQDYKNFANIFNSKNENVYIFEKDDNKTGIYKNKVCVNKNCLTDNDIKKINQKLVDNLIT
tara:strand:- start:493 stop:786 length:294 start_codon:yes stop_codon:yes gene_type:complete